MVRLIACFSGCVLLLGCGASSTSSEGPGAGADGSAEGSGSADGGPGSMVEGGSDARGNGDDAGPIADGGHPTGDDGGPPGDDGGAPEGGGQYFGRVLFELFYHGLVGAQTTSYDTFVDFAPPSDLSSVLACPPGSQPSSGCCFVPPAVLNGAVAGEVSAGDITLQDNGAPLTTLKYGPQGYDANNAMLMMGWMPGHLLQISAAGATVQAFSGQVVSPPVLALQGIMTQGTSVDVSVSADWTVKWAPASLPGDKLVAVLNATEGEVKCFADDKAGAVTFPASLLGKFNGHETGNLGIARVAPAGATSANATVEIDALTGQSVDVLFTP